MDTPFPIVRRFDYPKFDAQTFPNGGGRKYLTPKGDWVPSVTTILKILPEPEGITLWKKRIGAQKAAEELDEACEIGTSMHDYLEGYVSSYLQGRPDKPPETEKEKLAYVLADNIKRRSLINLDEVWGIEEALYCNDLYAGRTDLIGVYEGVPSVIDYKSAKSEKKPDWVESYKMQIAAYNFGHYSMFRERMKHGVILIAIRPLAEGEKWKPWMTGNEVQPIILREDEMQEYEEKWLLLVEEYYEALRTGKIKPVGAK